MKTVAEPEIGAGREVGCGTAVGCGVREEARHPFMDDIILCNSSQPRLSILRSTDQLAQYGVLWEHTQKNGLYHRPFVEGREILKPQLNEKDF